MWSKVETHHYCPSHALLRCPLSFFKSSKLCSLFLSVFISTHFGETLNPRRHMNGNVTTHMWHQITNQIPDWCEREITWSIFDLCHWLTGGEKWKRKQRKKVCHIFDMISGNYVCNFIGVRRLELLIFFFQWWQAQEMYSQEKNDRWIVGSQRNEKKNVAKERADDHVTLSQMGSFHLFS